MTKARKVFTPGSKPVKHVSPGRPKKKVMKKGTERKYNYRTRYNMEDLEFAIAACKQKRMTVREAALHYKVPKSTLHDRGVYILHKNHTVIPPFLYFPPFFLMEPIK